MGAGGGGGMRVCHSTRLDLGMCVSVTPVWGLEWVCGSVEYAVVWRVDWGRDGFGCGMWTNVCGGIVVAGRKG